MVALEVNQESATKHVKCTTSSLHSTNTSFYKDNTIMPAPILLFDGYHYDNCKFCYNSRNFWNL